ncbi:hypothetical protein CGRA01v4_14110 [Colletotrichum graminicola]|nr:hypothetical protein CGRA01v4_14110 [Colletotrichum graminicola]
MANSPFTSSKTWHTTLLALMFVHRPGQIIQGVIPEVPLENNAAHDYMSKSTRTRTPCTWQKKTGWLGKMEVTGKGRREKKRDKIVFLGRKGALQGIGLALVLVSLHIPATPLPAACSTSWLS